MSSKSGSATKELYDRMKSVGVRISEEVDRVLYQVDRTIFIPNSPECLHDNPHPIGYNATISAPHMHIAALEQLRTNLKPGSKSLDVGSGSGYLTLIMALMSAPGGIVVGIDHVSELVERSKWSIEQAGFKHLLDDGSIVLHVGDGRYGYEKEAPYDVIHVGAAASKMPDELIAQLKPGGRMIFPLNNNRGCQTFCVLEKKMDGKESSMRELFDVVYVPLTDLQTQLLR